MTAAASWAEGQTLWHWSWALWLFEDVSVQHLAAQAPLSPAHLASIPQHLRLSPPAHNHKHYWVKVCVMTVAVKWSYQPDQTNITTHIILLDLNICFFHNAESCTALLLEGFQAKTTKNMFSSGRLFKLITQQQFLLYCHYFLKLTRPGAKHLSFPI